MQFYTDQKKAGLVSDRDLYRAILSIQVWESDRKGKTAIIPPTKNHNKHITTTGSQVGPI